MKYLPLLELHLLHPYYADQRCLDFAIEPTPATQQLINNQRCVLKLVPDGLRLLLLVDDQNAPFIPLPADLVLTFQLKLQNPDFALFTDLTTYHQVADPVYSSATMTASPITLTLSDRRTPFTESLIVQQAVRGGAVRAERATAARFASRRFCPRQFGDGQAADRLRRHH